MDPKYTNLIWLSGATAFTSRYGPCAYQLTITVFGLTADRLKLLQQAFNDFLMGPFSAVLVRGEREG